MYVHGQGNYGINTARAVLNKYWKKTYLSLPSDITSFVEHIDKQEYASEGTITENIRCSIVDEKVYLDHRVGVHDRYPAEKRDGCTSVTRLHSPSGVFLVCH